MPPKRKSKRKIIFDLLRGRISDNNNDPNWMKILRIVALLFFWTFFIARMGGSVIISLPVIQTTHIFSMEDDYSLRCNKKAGL
jgi:hypothetical protein